MLQSWLHRLRIPLILLAVLIAFLLATPYVLKQWAQQWLLDNGGDQVRFEDVDFNPFSGTLILKELKVDVGDETTLSFEKVRSDLAWLPLLQKQIAVEQVEISGFDIIIDKRDEGRTLIGGIRLPDGDADGEERQTAESPWAAGLTALTLKDFNIRYRDSSIDLQLRLDHFKLSRLSQWSGETPAEIEAGGALNQAPFQLKGQLAPLASQPHYHATLKIDELALDSFSALLDQHLVRLAGHLSFDGQLDYAQTDAGFSVDQKGDIQLQSLDTILVDPRIHISNSLTAINSELHFASANTAQQLKLTADIRLNDTDIVAEDSHLKLLRAETLQFSGLDIADKSHIAIRTVDGGGLELGRRADNTDQDAYMDVEALQVSSLAYADNLLSIDSVHYRGGHSHMQRDAEGNWRIVGILNAMKRLTPADDDQQPAADTEPLAVSVNSIEVSGDSAISILDEQVEPAYQVRLDIDSATLTSLDTRKPEQNSPIKLNAGIGKHTQLSLQGHIQPFTTPIRMDLDSTVRALDLPPLSPYTSKSLGLVLDSGSLDADSQLKISENQMDGTVTLKLHQLEVDNVDSEDSLQSRLPVPLNVALDTLRDSHNTISLKIPVKGDPASPDFSINDALNQALAKGVQKGALTYLTLALQPYGSLITAAKYAGEAMNKVQLKPVEFEPGQTAIDDSDKDYLSKVAGVLSDRPKLVVKLCGVAVQADINYFQQQAVAGQKAPDASKQKPVPAEISETRLNSLAKARAASVKDYLVEAFGIPANRLVSCLPRLETGDKQLTPRTDLLI